MANIQYADPFGSYVKGQQEGQQQAINLGQAERQFRESDINSEFMKWYMPYRQQEVQAKLAQEQLATNTAQGQYLAALAASGDRNAQLALQAHIKQVTGIDMDISQKTPQETAWLAQILMRNVSPAFINPNVTSADHVGRYVPGTPSIIEQQPGESIEQWSSRIDSLPPNIKRLYGLEGTPVATQNNHPLISPNQDWLGGGTTTATAQPEPQPGAATATMPFNYNRPTSGSAAGALPTSSGIGPFATAPTPVTPDMEAAQIYSGGGNATEPSSNRQMPNSMPVPRTPTQKLVAPQNTPTVRPSIWQDERERASAPIMGMKTL